MITSYPLARGKCELIRRRSVHRPLPEFCRWQNHQLAFRQFPVFLFDKIRLNPFPSLVRIKLVEEKKLSQGWLKVTILLMIFCYIVDGRRIIE